MPSASTGPPSRVEIEGAKHMPKRAPPVRKLGEAGLRSPQFMKLFMHTPVPGMTTPEPYIEPSDWVRHTILPSPSTTDIDVVCSRAAAATGRGATPNCSVRPLTGASASTCSRKRETGFVEQFGELLQGRLVVGHAGFRRQTDGAQHRVQMRRREMGRGGQVQAV